MKRLKWQNGESAPRVKRPRYCVLYARPAGVVTEAAAEWIMAAAGCPRRPFAPRSTPLGASADNRPSSGDTFGTATDSYGTLDLFATAPTHRRLSRFSDQNLLITEQLIKSVASTLNPPPPLNARRRC